MRDALRYRQKRIGGKSGDSGDDQAVDEEQDDWELKDALAFLAPTSFRFPRKTTVLGGSAEAATSSFTQARSSVNATTDEDSSKLPFDLEDEVSNSSVYSYVCPKFFSIYYLQGKKSQYE